MTVHFNATSQNIFNPITSSVSLQVNIYIQLSCKHPYPKLLTTTCGSSWMCVYLALVALHLILQECLPGHLLKFFSQVLTRLHVGLGNVLGQMFWNTMQHTFKTHLSCLTALNAQRYWAILYIHIHKHTHSKYIYMYICIYLYIYTHMWYGMTFVSL